MRYPNQISAQQNDTAKTAEKAYIRFLHALPTSPSTNVDIYVNNRPAIKNFKYQDFTKYLAISPGDYSIQVYPARNTSTQLLDTNIVVSPNEILTVAVTNTPNNVEIETFSDYPREIDTSIAQMRFINLSSESPVDIYVNDNPVVYELGYTEQTDYIPFTPGRHTMTVNVSETGKTIVHHPNMILKGGNFYTTYTVGKTTSQPVMEVLIPLEGASYLNFK